MATLRTRDDQDLENEVENNDRIDVPPVPLHLLHPVDAPGYTRLEEVLDLPEIKEEKITSDAVPVAVSKPGSSNLENPSPELEKEAASDENEPDELNFSAGNESESASQTETENVRSADLVFKELSESEKSTTYDENATVIESVLPQAEVLEMANEEVSGEIVTYPSLDNVQLFSDDIENGQKTSVNLTSSEASAPSSSLTDSSSILGAVDDMSVKHYSLYPSIEYENNGDAKLQRIVESVLNREKLPFSNDKLAALTSVSVQEASLGSSAAAASVFRRLVKAFCDAERELDIVFDKHAQEQEDCQIRQESVWVKKTGVVEQTQPSRNGTGFVKASVNFPHAEFSLDRSKDLEKRLDALRKIRATEIPSARFEAALTKFRVEQHMYMFLASSKTFSPQSNVTDKCNSLLITDVMQVRHFFTVLINFERDICYDDGKADDVPWKRRCLFHIRGWLNHLAGALIQTHDERERMFLLHHAVRHRGIGSVEGAWMLSFVQLGPIHSPNQLTYSSCTNRPWDKPDIEMFLAMLEFLLTPVTLSDAADLNVGVSPHMPNVSRLHRYQSDGGTSYVLLEADFISLFEQCPHREAFMNMFPFHDADISGITVEDVTFLFARANAIIAMLGEAWCKLHCFPLFSRLLAQSSCVLLNYAGEFVGRLRGSITELSVCAQMMFDSSCLTAARYMMGTVDRSTRLVLSSLPLNRLTLVASWRLCLSLVLDFCPLDLGSLQSIYPTATNIPFGCFGCEEMTGSEKENDKWFTSRLGWSVKRDIIGIAQARNMFYTHQGACSLREWLAIVENDKLVRMRFLSSLNVNPADSELDRTSTTSLGNTGNAIYRLMALANIASAKGGDVANAVVRELVGATLLSGDWIRDDLLKPLRGLIGQICTAYPGLMSLVLHIVSLNLKTVGGSALLLFRTLPLHLWKPLSEVEDAELSDISVLREWILNADDTISCALAMEILERLNYGYVPTRSEDEDNPRNDVQSTEAERSGNSSVSSKSTLFLSPHIHRDIAIVLVEAHVYHSSLNKGPFSTVKKWVPMFRRSTVGQSDQTFIQWCWSRILELKLYDTETFEPFCSILDINGPGCAPTTRALHSLFQDEQKRVDEICNDRAHPDYMKTVITQFDPALCFVVLLTTNYLQIHDWNLLYVVLYKDDPFSFNVKASSNSTSVSDIALTAGLHLLYYLIPTYCRSEYLQDEYIGSIKLKKIPDIFLWVLPFFRTKASVTEFFGNMLRWQGGSSSDVTLGIPSGKWVTMFTSMIRSQFRQLAKQKDVEMLQAICKFWLGEVCKQSQWGQDAKLLLILNIVIRESACIHQQIHGSGLMFLVNDTMITQYNESFSTLISPKIILSGFEWVVFETLLIETGREYPIWCAMGDVLVKFNDQNIDDIRVSQSIRSLLEAKGLEISPCDRHRDFQKLSIYKIYRWASCLLELSNEHPLLPLYWQMFLSLYFSSTSGTVFGAKFLMRKKNSRKCRIREQLIGKADNLADFFGEQVRMTLQDDAASALAARQKFKLLKELFTGVGLWLREPDPSSFLATGTAGRPKLLGKGFCMSRLRSVLSNSLIKNAHKLMSNARGEIADDKAIVRRYLWLDLINFRDNVKEVDAISQRWGVDNRMPGCDKKEPTKNILSSVNLDPQTTVIPAPLYLFKPPAIQSVSVLRAVREGLDYVESHSPHGVGKDTAELGSIYTKYLGIRDPLQLLQSLKIFATRHSERIERLEKLDTQLMDALPCLYHREARVKSEEKTDDGRDRSTYSFEFHYFESVKDTIVAEKVDSLWEESKKEMLWWVQEGNENYLMEQEPVSEEQKAIWKAEHVQCITFLSINLVLDQLVALSNDEGLTKIGVALSHMGVHWFNALLDAENRHTRSYPPTRRLLWETIKKAGTVFVVGNPVQTQRIIISMLQDSGRVALLSPLFEPRRMLERTVEFYTLVWESLPQNSQSSTMSILNKFDFKAWLNLSPPLAIRKRLLLMVGGVLRQTSWVEDNPNNTTHRTHVGSLSIFKFHRQLFYDICEANFPDHFHDVCRILLGATVSSVKHSHSNRESASLPPSQIGIALHPDVWASFLEIPDDCWESVSTDDLLTACDIFSLHLKILRSHGSGNSVHVYTQPGSLLSQWGPLNLVKQFFRFISKIFRLLSSRLGLDNIDCVRIDAIWPRIEAMFEPWLSSSYAESSDGDSSDMISTKSNPPWPDVASVNKIAHFIMKTFVGIVCDLGKEGRAACGDGVNPSENGLTLKLAWSFYYEKLSACSPLYVMKIISSEIIHLEWQYWIVTKETLDSMENIVMTKDWNHPSFVLICGLLSKINWTVSEAWIRVCYSQGRETEGTISIYYAELLSMFLRILNKHALPIPAHISSFLTNIAAGLPWSNISHQDFGTVLALTSLLLRQPDIGVASDHTKTSVDVAVITTARHRALAMLQLLGNVTCLEVVSMHQRLPIVSSDKVENRQLSSGNVTAQDDLIGSVMMKAIEKELMYVRFLKSILVESNPNPASNEAKTIALPFSTASYVMILFASLRRIRIALLSVPELSAVCRTYHGLREYYSSRSPGQNMVNMLLREVFTFLNVDGVFLRAPMKPRHSNDHTTSAMINKIDSALTFFSNVLPSSVADRISRETPKHSQPITPPQGVWVSWSEMWQLVLPTMNEAANQNQFVQKTLSNRGGDIFSSPKRLLRRKNFSNKSNNHIKAEELNQECALDFLIAGAGCGTLLWEFIGVLSTFAPMFMVCGMENLQDEITIIDVLERCTDSWFVRTNDIEPLIAAFEQIPNCFGGVHGAKTDIGNLQNTSFNRGAWLSSYCFFIHGLAHGLKESATFIAISNCISSYSPNDTNNNMYADRCIRADFKLIPLLCLLLDLVLAEGTRRDLSDIFIIECLNEVSVKLVEIVDEKAGLRTITSNLIGRIMGSKSSSSFGPSPGESESGEMSKFKVMAYALSGFFSLNTTKVDLRVGQTDMPLNNLAHIHTKGISPMCVKTLAEMAQTDSQASWAHSFITNPQHNLSHANELITGLSCRLYPHMLWLCRGKNEYKRFWPDSIPKSKGVHL